MASVKCNISDQKCLRHGISTVPLSLLCKGDTTTKKMFFVKYIYYGTLDILTRKMM